MRQNMLLDTFVLQATDQLMLHHLFSVIRGTLWKSEVTHGGLSLQPGHKQLDWLHLLLYHVQERHLVQQDVPLPHPQLLHEKEQLGLRVKVFPHLLPDCALQVLGAACP